MWEAEVKPRPEEQLRPAVEPESPRWKLLAPGASRKARKRLRLKALQRAVGTRRAASQAGCHRQGWPRCWAETPVVRMGLRRDDMISCARRLVRDHSCEEQSSRDNCTPRMGSCASNVKACRFAVA